MEEQVHIQVKVAGLNTPRHATHNLKTIEINKTNTTTSLQNIFILKHAGG